MLKFAGDIGKIAEGVENLKDGQKEADEKLSNVHRRMDEMVTKPDCREHRDNLRRDVTGQFEAKLETAFAEEEPIVSGPPPVQSNGFLDRAAKNAKAITAILIFLGVAGGAILWFARTVAQLDERWATASQRQKAQTKAVLEELRKPQEPLIVYQPIELKPDAGMESRRMRWRRLRVERRRAAAARRAAGRRPAARPVTPP
jgi:hypothetical protein